MAVIERDPVALRRGRIATSLLFLLYGVLLGTWTARIPAIKQDLQLSDGRLSIALLALAAGAITGMQLLGRLVDRYGSATMARVALIDALLLIGPGLAFDLWSLAAALFVLGAVQGTLNIAMNANAVEFERAWGRPIMTSFHAVYSIGGFLGAGIGGLFADAGLGPTATFAIVAVAGLALAGFAIRWLVTPTAQGNDDIAAAGYAAFSIMMLAGRLVGDRLTARFGPVVLVRGCGILAGAGLGGALLLDHPIAGLVGFGCLGAGLSCIAPQVFLAAGNRDPVRAGRALARVASLGWLGFFVGPVAIGSAAEYSGLPVALVIPALLALFVAMTASALRRRPD